MFIEDLQIKDKMTKTTQNDIRRELCKHKNLLCHKSEFEICGRDRCYYVLKKSKKQIDDPELEGIE